MDLNSKDPKFLREYFKGDKGEFGKKEESPEAQEEAIKFKDYLKQESFLVKILVDKNNKERFRMVMVLLIYAIIIFFVIFLLDKFIINYFVHTRPGVKVPNIEGMPLDKAKQVLEQNKFRTEILKYQFNSKYDKGIILKQKPIADQIVKEKRLVYLTVSNGREMVQVPNVTGKTVREIRIVLAKSGLVLGNISQGFSQNVGKDTIISQSILPNQQANYGEIINLVVSKGAEFQIYIPNIVGMSYKGIENYINGQGFKLGSVTYKKDETYAPGTILSQNPKPNELLSKDTPIDIVISGGN